jgi:hypothetical protein
MQADFIAINWRGEYRYRLRGGLVLPLCILHINIAITGYNFLEIG